MEEKNIVTVAETKIIYHQIVMEQGGETDVLDLVEGANELVNHGEDGVEALGLMLKLRNKKFGTEDELKPGYCGEKTTGLEVISIT